MKNNPVNSIEVETLPVMEEFYSIQGEGYNAGIPAYFIRLGGCDVGCVWCDVKDSWEAEKHPSKNIQDIISKIIPTKTKHVIVTGGEPMMYNLDGLCTDLKQHDYTLLLETSGSWPLSGKWDWICVSPKKFKAPKPEVLAMADELKVIVYNTSDFDWAMKHASMVRKSCKLYLQPEWSRSQEMLPQLIEFIKENPQWNVSLQIHKFMNIP